MYDIIRWSSLDDQIALATQMYGRPGKRMLAEWLERQLILVNNLDFAREFSDHIEIPNISPLDYAHRRLRTQHGELVAGIRFYRRDIDRPFVDVLAHNFEDIAQLSDCVGRE